MASNIACPEEQNSAAALANDSEEDEADSAGVFARVGEFLDAAGLSALGRAAALNWIHKIADESADDLQHARAWLVRQLNATGNGGSGSRGGGGGGGSGTGGGEYDGNDGSNGSEQALRRRPRARLPPGASPWQRGCPDLVPGLTARPFWDAGSLPWIRDFEAAFPAIRRELLGLRGCGGFQPYRAPSWTSARPAADGVGHLSHDGGDWSIYYLYLHNVDFSENRARCPVTCTALEALLPAGQNYCHAFFSALAPGTHITKHWGPTNKKLRLHLPLVVPPDEDNEDKAGSGADDRSGANDCGGGVGGGANAEGADGDRGCIESGGSADSDSDGTSVSRKKKGTCRLRVGCETVTFRAGNAVVFDDSFEHEAWNDSRTGSRITLIVDVWHPDLSPRERRFLDFLQQAQMHRQKRACSAAAAAAVVASAAAVAATRSAVAAGTAMTTAPTVAEVTAPAVTVVSPAATGCGGAELCSHAGGKSCDTERRNYGGRDAAEGGDFQGGKGGEGCDNDGVEGDGDIAFDNFYAIIERAKSIEPEPAAIWQGCDPGEGNEKNSTAKAC